MGQSSPSLYRWGNCGPGKGIQGEKASSLHLPRSDGGVGGVGGGRAGTSPPSSPMTGRPAPLGGSRDTCGDLIRAPCLLPRSENFQSTNGSWHLKCDIQSVKGQ